MTLLEQAELLLDEAEREERAGDFAALAERNADAEQHYERARECRLQAEALLDQVTRDDAGAREAG